MNNNKDKYFLDKPEIIKLSLTNICNFKCIMCHNQGLKETRGYMVDELFFKIVDECKQTGIEKLALGSTGEVLLHKKFADYFKYAKSRGLWVSTTTNCTLLTPDISELLVSQKIDRIILSAYSSDPAEHFSYSGTDTFTQVVENIKYFFSLVRKNNQKMMIGFRFLPIPGINNYDKFVKFWAPIVKDVIPSIESNRMLNWAGLNNKYYGDNRAVQTTRIRCPLVSYNLHIIHNGDVLPCCNIPESAGNKAIMFGNLKQDTIMDVWTSEKYLSFKANHYTKNINLYKSCVNCAQVQVIKKPLISRIIGRLSNWPKNIEKEKRK